jgi:hypothetical protein
VPDEFHVEGSHAALMREIALDAGNVFTDPRIKVWRSLPDRENATLDHQRADGSSVRLHVKRYPPAAGFMAAQEIAGFKLLSNASIPCAPIIAHGSRANGSTFIILEDLADYTPADKLLAQGFPFEQLLNATADLAAKLHNQKLHHRDLYLCHFMIKPMLTTVDARLIDMARVARLDNLFTRRRWIVKDLAQLWYSTFSVPVTDVQRDRWLHQYCEKRGIFMDRLLDPIQRKSAAIARHDVQLRKQQPGRNVSIADHEKPQAMQPVAPSAKAEK